MSDEPKSLPQYLTEWLSNLLFSIRAAFSTPLDPDDERTQMERGLDPDFVGWLHNDPMVTENPANHSIPQRNCALTFPGKKRIRTGLVPLVMMMRAVFPLKSRCQKMLRCPFASLM